MKKPLRKDFPSHQAWVAAMDKFNAARPKRKDYKTHAEWVTALDLFNKNSKPEKTVKKDKPIERNIKSINNTNYDINTEAGRKAYNKAVNDSKSVKTENKTEKTENNEVKTNEKKYKQVTQKELDAKINEIKNKKNKKEETKKESRYIRNPKTKTLVRRTSQKGKQLLKIQARIDARNKRMFGDKKKKKAS